MLEQPFSEPFVQPIAGPFNQNKSLVDLIPQLSINPTSFDFGNEYIGYASDQIFVLTNTGNEVAEDIEVSMITWGGFMLLSSAGPFNIAKDGGTAEIEVRFTPSAEANYTGTLTIS